MTRPDAPIPAPIAEAYEQSGALTIACPHCSAPIGTYCTRSDGGVRRAPCVTRCRAITLDPGSSDVDRESKAAQTRSAPPSTVCVRVRYVDPAEPRHPRDDV